MTSPYHNNYRIQTPLACAVRLADTLCPPRRRPWPPGVILINFKGNNISKYVCPTDIIDIAQKSPNLSIIKILTRNDDVITE